MELEGHAKGESIAPFENSGKGRFLSLDWRPTLKWMVENRQHHRKESLAAAFHGGLALGTANLCLRISERTGIKHVALSGGVWQMEAPGSDSFLSSQKGLSHLPIICFLQTMRTFLGSGHSMARWAVPGLEYVEWAIRSCFVRNSPFTVSFKINVSY